jgi:hypothetical protein
MCTQDFANAANMRNPKNLVIKAEETLSAALGEFPNKTAAESSFSTVGCTLSDA